MCLASNVQIILSRRGYTKQTILNLIYEPFDDKRLDSV